MPGNKARIVIAGRTNVGKSTLFNRLTRSRTAITAPVAGTTRDLIEGEREFGGIPAILVDSGGISESGSQMDRIVSRKALSAISDADLVLFMLDAKAVNAEDEILIEHFRKFSDKIILVINKIDDPSHDSLVWNFHALGYKRVIAISAAHARGMSDLEDAIAQALSDNPAFRSSISNGADKNGDPGDGKRAPKGSARDAGTFGLLKEPDATGSDGESISAQDIIRLEKEMERSAPDESRVSISIMGKPNTGKSTLSNLLMRQEKSIVSDIAGTTRDAVRGEFEHKGVTFSVCDTAGMRRKTRIDEDIEYFSVNRAIKSIGGSDVVVLVIDCVEGVSDQDKKIASLAVGKGAGVVIALNKVDLLESDKRFRQIEDRLRFLFPHLSFAPIVGISALRGKGVEKLLDAVLALKKQLDRRISTSALNSALEEWNRAYSPPRNGAVWYKVLYATQISACPVRFLFIVNKKRGFPESYISYVKNRMRKKFMMDLIPIDVVIRERERKRRGQ